MDNCVHYDICKNNKICYRCFNEEYLKLPKERKTKKKIHDYKIANSDDSWKDLEQTSAKMLNNIPVIKDARRSRRSGALWFEKSDVVDEVVHIECKERQGRIIKKGADKSFTIQKSWIEKAKNEADNDNKILCLNFRFKGDEQIYNIMCFEDTCELINQYKSLKEENSLLLAEINVLKKKH